MKWAVLAIFIVLVPLLAAWMRSRPSSAPFFWGLLGFLPLIADGVKLDVAPISWALWAGYVRGVEVSLVDVVALSILIARPRIKGLPPFLFLWLFFGFTTFLSVFQADMPAAALFAVWQVVRVTIIFLAAASISTDTRGSRMLLIGMALGLAVNAGFSIQQRAAGALQADGLFGHQNLLGMVSYFAAFPALAMLLGGSRAKVFALGVAAAVTVAILSASRATIGLAGVGYGALLLLSLIRRPTPRKWGIVAAGVVGFAILAPLAISSLDRRFENTQQPMSEYDERAAFIVAAKAMIADHPFGQGANQYVVAVNTKGYSDAAGVGYGVGSRSAHVHHSYLLVAAEQGYLGLVAFIALLIWPVLCALKGAFANRKSSSGDLLLGIAVAIGVCMLQGLYEWALVVYHLQCVLAIGIGITSGIIRTSRATRYRDETVKKSPILKTSFV